MAEIAFFDDCKVDANGRIAISVGFHSDTGRQGIIINCVDGEIHVPRSQPDINMYPSWEQEYMKKVVTIVYKLAAGNDHNA